MAEKDKTVFQRINQSMDGSNMPNLHPNFNTYTFSGDPDTVLLRTTNKEEFDRKRVELAQNAYLGNMWRRISVATNYEAAQGLSNLKLMYRDADLMDQFPEIGAGLDTFAEEATIVNDEGRVLNIYSESDRVKAILNDLFYNRLSIQISAPMIIRGLCKYGNQYLMLNINSEQGVVGWKNLPVYEMERYEGGVVNPYIQNANGTYMYPNAVNNLNQRTNNEKEKNKDMAPTFQLVGLGTTTPFFSWQIAHFRLLTDSLFLPYGMSILHKGRRHWRMLSMMEDMMLIYRMDKSVERRVYKVNVGGIDEADVEAYMEQVMNNVKRKPIFDPETGQLDLRKSVFEVNDDFVVPVRNPSDPSPIETLAGAQNLTAIDDIKFVQNKLFTALEVPKTFLNFEEAQGNGQNLALMDVRFTRRVNRIQQAFLEELSRIAVIHLYFMGLEDEMTNFQLTMNNPSTQAEQMEIDLTQKKINALRDAVSDPGDGMPLMSRTNAYKKILHWSDKEITENLEGIRLDKALASELEKTPQIIKRTHLFDHVDRIYGEPNAEYQEEGQGQEGGPDGGGFGGGFGGGGGGFGGGDFGGELDGIGEVQGEEGSMPIEGAGEEDSIPDMGGGEAPEAGGAPKNESLYKNGKPLIVETKGAPTTKFVDITDRGFLINEDVNDIIREIKMMSEKKEEDINE